MKDFGRWLREFPTQVLKRQEELAEAEATLPTGFYVFENEICADCCVCGKRCVIEFDIAEIKDINAYQHYCGGSPRCCP